MHIIKRLSIFLVLGFCIGKAQALPLQMDFPIDGY